MKLVSIHKRPPTTSHEESKSSSERLFSMRSSVPAVGSPDPERSNVPRPGPGADGPRKK
jgi:hypothetical protein